jgi:asparagine synthase (glutamine-hydrolysing)
VQEFAATLPARMKLRGRTSKWVLRELAARRGLPRDLVDRRKQGFGVPIGDWFRHELRGWLTDVLLDGRTRERGYFRDGAVGALVDEHLSGRQAHTTRLWNLLMLELWHREWVDA